MQLNAFRILPLLVFVSGWAAAATLPVGTEIQARFLTEVSSAQQNGQPVRAVITAPVFAGDTPLLAIGVQVEGTIGDVLPALAAADNNGVEQVATVRVTFGRIHDAQAHASGISAVVSGVDNARESVDATGLIQGIKASETIESRINQGINKIANRNQGFAELLAGIEGTLVQKVDAAIDFKPGVDFTLKLTAPLDWSFPDQGQQLPGPLANAAALARMANAQPTRTVAENPPLPSDLTNVLLLGTLEQIQAAFGRSGWYSAAKLGRDSRMETARAIIENRGYNEAPVSVLFLDGRPPDIAMQKQTDTFAMRHHIRIWSRPGLFEGQQIWIAAATHDIAISLSPVSHSFTHKIDSNIDRERSRVVSDLVFTGLVRSIALVDRMDMPRDASNATGDHLQTDGKIAVLQF